MAAFLEHGAAWLAGQLQKHASRTVLYIAANDTIQVEAVIGTTEFQEDRGDAGIVTWESRDYLIPADALVAKGKRVEPKPGDLVKELDAERSIEHVYEVNAGGAPCWNWSDHYHLVRRIHTKQIAARQ